MNADRRITARLCITLMTECSEWGEMSDDSHALLNEAVASLQNAEHWQLRNQGKHLGKNPSTDRQIHICEVALPALENAKEAMEEDDFEAVILHLTTAIETDGTPPAKATPKIRKRKARA